MPAAKKLTPQQQRDRRSKIMLGVLGAVLLVVMAVELPGLLGGKKTAASPAASTTSTTTTGAAATPAAALAAASLASVQVVAGPEAGQLTKFSRFAAKDPFHPLVNPNSGVATRGGGAATSPTGVGGTKPPAVAPSPKTPPSVPFTSRPAPTKTQPTGPMVLGAVLKLNGTRQVIPVGTEFPASNPVFKLVAVGRTAMWISLVGGSFGSGDQSLKIELGHPVKLVNQTADQAFVLNLLKVKLVPKPAPQPAVTTVPATTTGSASTTSATTTTTG
jgi:hypothetical protein